MTMMTKTMFTLAMLMMMTMTMMTLGARAGATTSQDGDDEQDVRRRTTRTSRRRRLQAHGSSFMQCFGPLLENVCLAADSCCTWNDSGFEDIPDSMKCNVNYSCVDFGLDFNDDSTTTTNSTTNNDGGNHDGFLPTPPPSYDDYLFSGPTVNTYSSGDNTSWSFLICIPLVLICIVFLLMKGKAIHLELTADDGDLCLGQNDIENSSPVAVATSVTAGVLGGPAPASPIDVCSYPIAVSAPISFDAVNMAVE